MKEYPGFDKFWKAYPHSRRTGKKKCLARWVKEHLEDRTQEVLATLESQKLMDQWQEQKFIPLSTTWMNRGDYDREIDNGSKTLGPKCRAIAPGGFDAPRPSSLAEHLARLAADSSQGKTV